MTAWLLVLWLVAGEADVGPRWCQWGKWGGAPPELLNVEAAWACCVAGPDQAVSNICRMYGTDVDGDGHSDLWDVGARQRTLGE